MYHPPCRHANRSMESRRPKLTPIHSTRLWLGDDLVVISLSITLSKIMSMSPLSIGSRGNGRIGKRSGRAMFSSSSLLMGWEQVTASRTISTSSTCVTCVLAPRPGFGGQPLTAVISVLPAAPASKSSARATSQSLARHHQSSKPLLPCQRPTSSVGKRVQ